MFKLIKQLFCRHNNLRFNYNLTTCYSKGYFEGYRSSWICKDCGKFDILKKELYYGN